MFASNNESHQHSLETLTLLQVHSSFMESVDTLCDMGCGSGADLEWWATCTVACEDESELLLEINCLGVDTNKELSAVHKHDNIQFLSGDFENITIDKKQDVIWCHDSFQFAINPLQTLGHWYNVLDTDGMLVLLIPQTTNIKYNRQSFVQPDYHYYNHTLVSLIYMLSVNGFDCRNGFFQKHPTDPWLKVVVYKSATPPMDYKTTKWYHLAETELLPESACDGINSYGVLRQEDLILPWLDGSLRMFNNI